MENIHNTLRWAIGIGVTVWLAIAGWIIHRVSYVNKKTDETRIVLAERHYTKLEVDHLVNQSIKPIHDKLNSISDDIKYLVRERRDNNS